MTGAEEELFSLSNLKFFKFKFKVIHRRERESFTDAAEGPRAPAVKLTARHSSLTRVRAAPLSPW